MRRQRHVRVVAELALDAAAAGSVAGHDPAGGRLIDLATALQRLPADDRALLALRYVADFDATELGRALGSARRASAAAWHDSLPASGRLLDHD